MQRMPVISPKLGVGALEGRVSVRFRLLDAIAPIRTGPVEYEIGKHARCGAPCGSDCAEKSFSTLHGALAT